MDSGVDDKYCSTECKIDYQTEQNNYLDYSEGGAELPSYEKIIHKKEKKREM